MQKLFGFANFYDENFTFTLGVKPANIYIHTMDCSMGVFSTLNIQLIRVFNTLTIGEFLVDYGG